MEMYLELSQGEAATSANLAVVLDGRATNGRAQQVERARGDLLGLGDTGLATQALLGRLVEPGLHTALPVLVEVTVGDNVVVLNHFALD